MRPQVQRRQAQRPPQTKSEGSGGKPKTVADSTPRGRSPGGTGRGTGGDQTAPSDTASPEQRHKPKDPPLSGEKELAKHSLLQTVPTAAEKGPKDSKTAEEESPQPSSANAELPGALEQSSDSSPQAGEATQEGTSKTQVKEEDKETGLESTPASAKGTDVVATPPELAHRFETAYLESIDTKAKVETLSRLIDMVTTDRRPPANADETAGVSGRDGDESRIMTFITEDVVGRAALVGALESGRDPMGETEEYQEAVQSSDAAEFSVTDVHVVGDIVASASRTDHDVSVNRLVEGGEGGIVEGRSEGVSSSRPTVDQSHVSTTVPAAVDQSHVSMTAPTGDFPAVKKPKRQLAASFGPQHA